MDWKKTIVTVWMLALVACESPSRTVTPARDPISTLCPVGYFLQTDLVSDQPGVTPLLDPSLVNGWDLASNVTSPFWVSSNAGNVIDLYSGTGPLSKASLMVSIPDGGPTGVVFNPTTDFVIASGGTSGRAIFLFATQGGELLGWNPSVSPTTAVVAARTPGAAYTGLALAVTGSGSLLYAADFQRGKIDVFDGMFRAVSTGGSFSDSDIPARYHPFNVAVLGGRVYVTYAAHHGNDSLPQGGLGFVDVFDRSGNLIEQIASGHPLKGPWGLALAPADFGPFGGALLVGNTMDGQINAYDPVSGDLLGKLRDEAGKPIAIDGLHGLLFGNGGNGGSSSALYFVAGPDGGQHGLLGSLSFIPQP